MWQCEDSKSGHQSTVTMEYLLAVISTFVTVCVCLSKAETESAYVFGADPSGGVWGGKVDLTTGMSEGVMEEGFLSSKQEVNMVTYDLITHQLLIQYRKQNSIHYGAICKSEVNETHFLTNITKFSMILDGKVECLQCEVTSFALHDSDIYFILVGEFGPRPNITKKVQLRVLESCSECSWLMHRLGSLSSFQAPLVYNCSRLIVEIFSQVEFPGEVVHVKAATTLKVVPTVFGPSFFFQIFTGTRQTQEAYDDMTLDLYHVTPTNKVLRLRSESVHDRYATWNIPAIASVDYKEPVLCWSVGDRLHCAEYKDKALSNIQLMLFPGESAASQVCTGDNLDLLAIVTGVAVAKARDGLIIFFGCHPNWPGVGGAGLITLSADWQVKKIFSVTDNKLGKRYAGSIFTTDVISDKCNGEDVPPHICTSVPLNNPPSDDPYVRKGDRDGNSTTSNTAATSKSFTSLTWTIIFFWHLAWLTPVCHQT